MKRILITGAGSYIGTSFENYIKCNFQNEYIIDTVDMIDGSWRVKDFSGYDTVFHVAGIAHQKETKENCYYYYKINRDLAVETAQKAKYEGVKQFIFLSSMSVYGLIEGEITKDTLPKPNTHYGISKYEAENLLNKISNESYHIAIIRPPMVYGKSCKGNFNSIVNIVKKLPFFPKICNKRSMIYIDHLSEFIRLIIEKDISGTFCPQNSSYVSTSEMAAFIAEKINKKINFSKLLGIIIRILKVFIPIVKKAFGDLTYNVPDDFDYKYCTVDFKESIERSV